MSVIDEALRLLSTRLQQVERETRELRAAIAAVENARASSTRAAAPARRYQPDTTVPRRLRARTRAPRGENRRKILAAIHDHAKTANEISAETGITKNTTASTLRELIRTGQAAKATRGYQATHR